MQGFYFSGGGGGNRTRVQKHFTRAFSERSYCLRSRHHQRPVTYKESGTASKIPH